MQFSGLHAAGYIKIYTYNILDYVHLKELQLKDLIYYKWTDKHKNIDIGGL